nr:sodium:hydrogen exchanger [Hymenolepis microstoma]
MYADDIKSKTTEFANEHVLYPPLAINAALQFKQIFKYGILPATVVFGLIGSFFNFIITALSLWLVHEFGLMGMKDHNVKPIAFALFSSLICSTDLVIVFGLLGKLKVHPFLYLLFVATHEIVWHTGFIVWTTFFSIFWRFVFIFMASFLNNYFLWTRQKISLGMMFFISYGGFKGSVAHALVEIISPKTALAIGIPLSILRCTVVFINLFYVLFIGLTMTPLLRIYEFLSSETGKLSLFETLNDRVIQSACNAMADVVGHNQGLMRTAFVKFYKRYLSPLLLRDPDQHDEITDVYADIALALHHASVAKDRHAVHFHLRRLRPQLKKAFYYQQQNSIPHNETGRLLKPLNNVHLHHIDFITDSGLDSSHQHHDHSSETPKDGVISDSNPEVSYDIESNRFPKVENRQARHSLKTAPRRRRRTCCGYDLVSSDSDSASMDDLGEDCLKSSSSSSERRRHDKDEGLFRELLSRHNQHTYAFDESAFAEQVQASFQSKHRALKLHHF